jgi:hypothetical protein
LILEDLLAEREIRRALVDYCRAIDRFDRELARTVWHPGATVDYVGIFEGAAEAFMEWIWETHVDFEAHSHQITNLTVSIDGDRASSEAYVTVRLRLADRRADVVSSARYLDRWSRRNGLWAIDQRVFVRDVYSVYEVSAAKPATSRRDAGDLSYGVLGTQPPPS